MACSCGYEHDHDDPGNDDTISVEEALGMARSLASRLDPETVPLREVADDLLPPDPVRPYPASVKDVYAVLSKDGLGIHPIIGEARAEVDAENDTAQPCTMGHVTSGDAIVQAEDTLQVEEGSTTSKRVPISTNSAKGQDICPVI